MFHLYYGEVAQRAAAAGVAAAIRNAPATAVFDFGHDSSLRVAYGA